MRYYNFKSRQELLHSGICPQCKVEPLVPGRKHCSGCLDLLSRRVLDFYQSHPGYNSYLNTALKHYGSDCLGCGRDQDLRVGPVTKETYYQWRSRFRVSRNHGGLGIPFWRWLKESGYPYGFGALCPNCLAKAVRGEF